MPIASLPRRAYGVRPVPVVVAALAALLAWLVFGTDLVIGRGGDRPPVVAAAPIAETPANAPAEPAPPPEPPPVYPSVLVANRDIPQGVLLSDDLVEWRAWNGPVDVDMAVVEGAVPKRAVLGAVTRRTVGAGTMVSWDLLLMPGSPGFISAVLAPGMRAVTVSVDSATTSARIIYPGDRVDVIMVSTAHVGGDVAASRTIVRDTRVLAVGEDVLSLGRYGTVSLAQAGEVLPARAPEGSTFTLEVPPVDAERIAVALAVGHLTLATRSIRAIRGGDDRTRLVRLGDVMRPPPGPAPEPVVRVFRGSGSPTLAGGHET